MREMFSDELRNLMSLQSSEMVLPCAHLLSKTLCQCHSEASANIKRVRQDKLVRSRDTMQTSGFTFNPLDKPHAKDRKGQIGMQYFAVHGYRY